MLRIAGTLSGFAQLSRLDFVVLNEPSYLPFARAVAKLPLASRLNSISVRRLATTTMNTQTRDPWAVMQVEFGAIGVTTGRAVSRHGGVRVPPARRAHRLIGDGDATEGGGPLRGEAIYVIGKSGMRTGVPRPISERLM